MSEKLITQDYKIIPGRGLVTKSAIKVRLDYLKELGFDLDHISRYFLDHTSVQNNIESFIGTVEIPLGIVGPLLFEDLGKQENVYTAAGTLEGALVASMNRGAKAISLSNGFTAKVIHQKMVRAPLFFLKNLADASRFESWIKKEFNRIKEIAKNYSNHAELISLSSHPTGPNVHVKFVYTTGDASGQNMTTTCTWHAMLWIVESFMKETGIEIPHFVIEGNGSSDKKVSHFLVDHGRGTCVTAECFLEEATIQKVLRTSSESIFRCFGPSQELAKQDGMLGYNINVANAIAAIFVATGQDLGSLHESSIGILNLEKKENGLKLQLTLPSLVIGTVGGGTGVASQQEALQLMDCLGNGKAERFAKLIAGFALALEISTYSAIVSGEFAKAHEKLGRNKPTRWLLKSELNPEFIKKCLTNQLNGISIEQVTINDDFQVENGILTSITQRVNKKLTGFIPLSVLLGNKTHQQILVKSKALDLEVIKGLHIMAASIDPQLSDLLYQYRENLEYWNCHHKELAIYECLSKNGFNTLPKFYGKYVDEGREIYLLFQELFDKEQMELIDTENSPHLWTQSHIEKTITAIHEVHVFFSNKHELSNEVKLFEPWLSAPLYQKMAAIINQENEREEYTCLTSFIDELETLYEDLKLPTTIIHHDFNPRNVAWRKTGLPCIYDWELAVRSIPHRDVVEFLCFSLPIDFNEEDFLAYLKFHVKLANQSFPGIKVEDWQKGYSYSLKEFLVTRAAFYKVSEILMKLKFGDRVMLNAIRMIKILAG